MSTIKHLLPPVKRYLKANLHAHSTISDGTLTPQEMKDAYKTRGYSILCLTDHNIAVDHSDLNDENFLMLTGAEYDVAQGSIAMSRNKAYHINMIAKKPDTLWQPFANETYKEETLPYLEKAEIENMAREHSVEAINAMIARGNEKGHLVSYNHPAWSLHDYTDYAGLKGLWGMELCNSGSVVNGIFDHHNATIFRDMMNLNGPIFPIGADDGHRLCNMFGAWVMIGAEELEYSSVITALEKGDFYATTGPEIYSLTWDGTVLKISCSDAAMISVECSNRYGRTARPVHNDGLLREAEIDMGTWMSSGEKVPGCWFRVVVNGPYGHYASTRAFTYEELK